MNLLPVPFLRCAAATNNLFVLLCMAFLIQGCAAPYGKVVRDYRDAPSCCASLAELPTEQLNVGDKQSFDLGNGSPAYLFATGKSYFRVFILPDGPYPYKVAVSSYIVGDYLKTSYLFYPQLITLDDQRRVVRSTGSETFTVAPASFMESIQTAGEFRYKIEGGLVFSETNRDERYLVVLTTDELLKGKTPVPSGEVPMLIPGASSTESKDVQVPHAPGGKITVSLVVPRSGRPADAVSSVPAGGAQAGAAGSAPGASSDTVSVHAGGTSAPRPRPEIVNVRLASGKMIGTFELGRTTVDEARNLFDTFASGFGRERANTTLFTIGSVSVAPKRLFTPPGTPHQLYFDDNGKLVIFMDGTAADAPAAGSDFRSRFPEARETWRAVGSYELQAELGPCVTLIAVYRALDDSFDSAAFGYRCPTR